MDFFQKLFDSSDFPARWTCGKWTEAHGWLHIISDILIWGAYMAIPIALAYFVLRRKDLPFLPIFWLFAAFIFACGTSHLVEAAIFWWPAYRFSGMVKLITAIVSWMTVAALIPTLPRALELPRLEKANVELSDALSRFTAIFEAAPNGMLLVDNDGRIAMSNAACEAIFGYASDDLAGMSVEQLVPDRNRPAHPELRKSYQEEPVQRPMGHGRDLYGRRTDGSEVAVEIGLNPITVADEEFTLATIVDISERLRLQRDLERRDREKDRLIVDLRRALDDVKQLEGMLPICAACKKVRDDDGFWEEVETYIGDRTGALFSHGYCPECRDRAIREIEEADTPEG